MERHRGCAVRATGEASHGTSEYYTWRTRISQRLIREKGFSFIAVEGDWPDCYQVNRYVRAFGDAYATARETLDAFGRWPTWMWANEVLELTEWLLSWNDQQAEERHVGFYGLDVYSLLRLHGRGRALPPPRGPEAANRARRAYGCFDPYEEDVQRYAMATTMVPTSCEDEAVNMLRELRRKAPEYQEDGREAFFNAEQNALTVKNAELYYRTMVRGGPTSWNVRDTHMEDTLGRLMAFHGSESKAIVWEHNTHIGDARATDMARAGLVNVGQLVRESWDPEGVVLVGFGSHRGSVIAGDEWGAPMRRMPVPPARQGTWEDLFHRAGPEDKLFIMDEVDGREGWEEPRGHRAIGVVYDPAAERWGNYVPTVLPLRYDAFLYLDETQALRPLPVRAREDAEVPETYPSGM